MFHALIVLSKLPENSRGPSADTHTNHTDSGCPGSVRTHAPVATFHTFDRVVPTPREQPRPTRTPSLTQSVCPRSVCTHAPVPTSHTLIMSSLPENSREPSADTHTEYTAFARPSVARPSSAYAIPSCSLENSSTRKNFRVSCDLARVTVQYGTVRVL